MELIDTFLNVSELKEWEKNLTTDGRHMLTGLVGSSKTLMIAKLLKDKKVPQLIVESDLYHAQQLQSDLENIIEDTRIELFPVEDMLVAEMATSSPEYRAQRVSALTALTSENPVIVITTVAGIRRFLPSVEYWKQHEIQLEIGKEVNPAELEKKLFEMGYIRSNMVNAPGDFAIRGSIVDIFPLDADNPYRIDFFDIEIDSMRTFDIANQRSIENVDQVTIIPATDFIASKEVLELASKKIKKEYKMGLFMICIKGQTKEMILRDIELAQEYFDEIALSVFVNNDTKVERDEELVKWFLTEIYPELNKKKNIEILVDNKDFGVYVQ